MSSWNPELYLKFKKERTRPAEDLILRIDMKYPKRILDVGCGPGNSSNELKKRWPTSEILGLDSSSSMVEKASKDYPGINFILADATNSIDFLGKFDLVFSNAAIQWMPGISEILPKFFELLNPKGVMAVQVPNPSGMPIQIAVDKVADSEKWKSVFMRFSNGLFLNEPGYYYDILTGLTDDINLWETHYYHKLPAHESVIEWYASTGMKPYLELLKDSEKVQFSDEVLKIIKQEYPVQNDGSILFPFRRIFFTASKV